MSESINPYDEPAPEGYEDQDLEPGPIQQTPLPMGGNRPASGARHSLPGEAFAQEAFQGSENAGDFLGLDTEFTDSWGGADPGGGSHLFEDPGGPALQGQDPYVGMESGSPTQFGAGGYAYDDEGYDEEGGSGVIYAEDDPYEGDLDADLAKEYDAEFGSGASSRRGGRKALLVGVAVVAAVAVLGVKFGPRFLSSGDDTAGTQVAVRDPLPTPGPEVAPADPTPVDPAVDPGADPSVAVTDPAPADPMAADPGPGDAGGDAAGGKDPAVDPVVDPVPVEVAGGDEAVSPGFEDLLSGLGDLLGSEGAAGATGASQAGTGPFPDFAAGFEWVTEDMLDMVWRGEQVPMEAISAPARTLMPYVGAVRVHMHSGETFDGRLYAVGQDRVWIDAEPGRIGLDGTQVKHFEHLPVPASMTGEVLPAPTGERVRVHVPGGILYGQVLAVDGNLVTLLSEDGGKIVLENPHIEPLGLDRAIVVSH